MTESPMTPEREAEIFRNHHCGIGFGECGTCELLRELDRVRESERGIRHEFKMLQAGADAQRKEFKKLEDLEPKYRALLGMYDAIRAERDELKLREHHPSCNGHCEQLGQEKGCYWIEQLKKERDEALKENQHLRDEILKTNYGERLLIIRQDRDRALAECERLRLVNREIASALKDGDVCPACGASFEKGTFQECGGSLVKERLEAIKECERLKAELEKKNQIDKRGWGHPTLVKQLFEERDSLKAECERLKGEIKKSTYLEDMHREDCRRGKLLEDDRDRWKQRHEKLRKEFKLTREMVDEDHVAYVDRALDEDDDLGIEAGHISTEDQEGEK